MEQVIISETETVVVDVDTAITVVTGLIGPKGEDGTSTSTSLRALVDVDMANITDGALLVYSALTGKWHATNNLNNQIFEAGLY